MKRLLLVGLDWTRKKDPPISLAMANIAAACQDVAASTQVITEGVNSEHFDLISLSQRIAESSSSASGVDTVVGISGYVWAEKHLRLLPSLVKERLPNSLVVMGGPQVTYAPKDMELDSIYPGVDSFISGYGEVKMRQILQPENLNLSLKLENMPSPFLTGWILPQRFIRWETQRGCPFTCTFCQHCNVANARVPFNKSRVHLEAQWICDHNHIIRDVAVVDPTFNSGKNYMNVLEVLTRRGFNGKISLQCRLEMMNHDFINAIKAIKDHVVLEFGVQSIHRNEQALIDRKTNMRKVEFWLRELNDAGINYELSFIYGLPGSTLSSFRSNVQFAEEAIANARGYAVARFFPLMLLRGTPLWDERKKHGLITSKDLDVDISLRVKSDIPHVIQSSTFSKEEWFQMNLEAEILNKKPSLSPIEIGGVRHAML